MTNINANTQSRFAEASTTATHEFQDAQKELADAKKNGASDAEIEKLTKKQQTAFDTFRETSRIGKTIRDDGASDETVNASLDKVEKENELKAPSTLREMSSKDQLKLQRENPEEFRKQMDKIPAGEKQSIYMSIQNEVQSENRFWSMMTNTQQASHDTQKSILSNFRV